MVRSTDETSIVDQISSGCLLGHWRRVNRVLSGIYEAEMRDWGLKSSQLSLLVAVAKAGPVRRIEDIRKDRQDIRQDRRERREDRRELRQDIKKGDAQGARQERREIRKDTRDIRKDKRDLRDDRKDRREDRREQK